MQVSEGTLERILLKWAAFIFCSQQGWNHGSKPFVPYGTKGFFYLENILYMANVIQNSLLKIINGNENFSQISYHTTFLLLF